MLLALIAQTVADAQRPNIKSGTTHFVKILKCLLKI